MFYFYLRLRYKRTQTFLPKHGAVDLGSVQTCIYVQVLMFNGESPLGLIHVTD
jgi:hypothetical protein